MTKQSVPHYLRIAAAAIGFTAVLAAGTSSLAWGETKTTIYLAKEGHLWAGLIDGTNHPTMRMIDHNSSGDPRLGWSGQIAAQNGKTQANARTDVGFIYTAKDDALFGAPIMSDNHPSAPLIMMDNSGWTGPLAVSDGYIYQLRGKDLFAGAVTEIAHPGNFHGIDGNFLTDSNHPGVTDIAVMNGYIYAILGRDIYGAPIDGANHQGTPVLMDSNFIFDPGDAHPQVALAAGNGYLYAAYKGNLWGGRVAGTAHPAMKIVDANGWSGDITVGVVDLPEPPKPAPARSYIISLDSFAIEKTRSSHEDTDFVSFTLKVGNQIFSPQIKSMGDLNDGTYPVGLTFGPVQIDDDTPVEFNYQIVNSGHKSFDEIRDALLKGSAALFSGEKDGDQMGTECQVNTGTGGGEGDNDNNGSPWWWCIATSLFKTLWSLAFADCDGLVAADGISTNGRLMSVWTRSGSYAETRFYPGTESNAGCGGNSRYYVTWSVRPQ